MVENVDLQFDSGEIIQHDIVQDLPEYQILQRLVDVDDDSKHYLCNTTAEYEDDYTLLSETSIENEWNVIEK